MSRMLTTTRTVPSGATSGKLRVLSRRIDATTCSIVHVCRPSVISAAGLMISRTVVARAAPCASGSLVKKSRAVRMPSAEPSAPVTISAFCRRSHSCAIAFAASYALASAAIFGHAPERLMTSSAGTVKSKRKRGMVDPLRKRGMATTRAAITQSASVCVR